MSGLILLFVLGVWFFIAKKLTSFLTTKMQVSTLKKATQVLLFAMILVAPVADEIVGGFQFRALCEREAVAIYDKDKLYGKTVHQQSANVTYFTNTILPSYKQLWVYADDTTNQEVISYADLHSDGGWLSRWIDFNSVHSPYSFIGHCSGDKNGYLFQNLNIKNSDKP
jgi:hypothetical protein